MADVSQWDANELKNLKLDELNLSDERGKRTAKIMSAVKKKFDTHDKTLSQIGSWTDSTRTDTLKDAVEQLESDVASIVTGSQTVDMETIIATDDVLSVNPGLLNWQKTERAGAVSCYPVPGVTMDPVVEFKFAETPPEEGDKAPDNPSTLSGVSDIAVGRVGKNLLLKTMPSISSGGYTTDSDEDGTWHIDGSGALFAAITDGGSSAAPSNFSSVVLDSQKTYTLSCTVVSGSLSDNVYVSLADGSSPLVVFAAPTGTGTTYTSFSGALFSGGRFHGRLNTGDSGFATDAVLRFQLEEGTTATEWEPPMLSDDTNFTVDLGSTYYGGTVNLSSGVVTVTQALSGVDSFVEVINVNANTVQVNGFVESSSAVNTNICSNRFVAASGNSDSEHCRMAGTSSSGSHTAYFWIAKSRLDVSGATDPSSPTDGEWLAAANAWLTSNPVYLCTELFSPYTIDITPVRVKPLSQKNKYNARLNTMFSDAESIQIVYAKSPIRTEYELTQAIIATEGGV